MNNDYLKEQREPETIWGPPSKARDKATNDSGHFLAALVLGAILAWGMSVIGDIWFGQAFGQSSSVELRILLRCLGPAFVMIAGGMMMAFPKYRVFGGGLVLSVPVGGVLLVILLKMLSGLLR